MDFFDIGAHCDFCARQDYLPFRCDSCEKMFCKDHIDKIYHKCASKRIINPKKIDGKQRSLCNRYLCVLEPHNTCDSCGEKFCITHIPFYKHDCTGVVPRYY